MLPAWRLPVAHAFSFMHATDRRPVFVFPWEGATVVGTTDLDHRDGLGEDARISRAELDYLLAACAQRSPPLPSRRATCCLPGPACDRWSAAATTAASLPTRNASMCSGASRAA
ncbi:hypothetical protein P4132_24700 [Pseudomonas aeruginosa]|nr:hypothetical protein [Pseudomonas aeruginosa]